MRIGVVAPVLNGEPNLHSTEGEETGAFPLLQAKVSNPLPFIPGSTGYFWMKKGLKLFKEYVQQNGEPDLVHAHSALYAGVLASKIKKKYGIPYILTEHSSYISRRDIPKWKVGWVQTAFRNASLNLGVSIYMKDSIREHYGPRLGKWAIVPNLVDEKFFTQQLPIIDNEPFKFLNIGGLIKVKSQDVLLEAFAECKAELDTKIKLTIVGDGNLQGKLQKLAAQLGLDEAVEWIPDTPTETIPYLMARSHAVISSSFTETFGMTLAEALAVGRPVVSTDSGGPRDIVVEEVGKLVPKNEPDLLANAMIEMVKEHSSYDPHSLRQYAHGKYHKSRIVGKLHEIYKGVLGS